MLSRRNSEPQPSPKDEFLFKGVPLYNATIQAVKDAKIFPKKYLQGLGDCSHREFINFTAQFLENFATHLHYEAMSDLHVKIAKEFETEGNQYISEEESKSNHQRRRQAMDAVHKDALPISYNMSAGFNLKNVAYFPQRGGEQVFKDGTTALKYLKDTLIVLGVLQAEVFERRDMVRSFSEEDYEPLCNAFSMLYEGFKTAVVKVEELQQRAAIVTVGR